MMDKRTFVLAHEQARKSAIACVQDAPEGYAVVVREPTRTLEQNALLWPLLAALSEQIVWYGQKLSDEDWKDLLTASLTKQRSAPAIDGGGFVVFGQRTSEYGKKMFSDLIELIYAFGAERDVDFSRPSVRKI